MVAKSNLFFIFAISVIVINIKCSVLSAALNCPSNCECSEILNSQSKFVENVLNINCYKTAPTFHISLYNRSYLSSNSLRAAESGLTHVTINCTSLDTAVYDILWEYNITNVKSIEFNGCALPPGRSFGYGMPHLNELTFVNTKFNASDRFEYQHFSDLDELSKLRIRTNTANELAIGLLDNIPKLKYLGLEITKPNFDILQNLTSLSDVSLGYDLNDLNTDIFKDAPRIRSLTLIANRFGRLTKRSFRGLSFIEKLNFTENSIENIEPDAFEPVTELNQLAFIRNRIFSLPHGLLAGNKALKQITIDGGSLRSLPEGFLSNQRNLRQVFINCNLTSVPGDLFQDSANIETIDFSQNTLTTLPAGLFDSQQKLKFLSLKNNQLETLPDDIFKNLRELTSLILGKNRFKSISDALTKSLPSTPYIDLEANQITDIQDKDLEAINTKAVKIDLTDNLITKIGAATYWTNSIDEYSGFISLAYNPFNCTCDVIVPFIRLLQRDRAGVLNIFNLHCATPYHLKHARLYKATLVSFNCL